MDNLLGEFFGTMVLMVFGCGVCACNTLTGSKGQNGGWICITAGWGFAVTLGVFTATTLGAPQGDLNPAVTLGKTMIGIYTWEQFAATAVIQILGGICGAALVWLAYLPHWAKTEDKAAKLGIFCTAPAIRNYPLNFLCEVIATFFLMFVIWMIFSSRPWAVYCRRFNLGTGYEFRRAYRVRYEPGSGFGTAYCSRYFADCRQGQFGLGLCLGSSSSPVGRCFACLCRSCSGTCILMPYTK